MWKIKLISKSKELPEEEEEEESSAKMKAEKNGEVGDVKNSAEKKLKQARLPFQILSPKSSSPVVSDSEKSSKKRKLSEDSTVDISKTKLCKTDVKENVFEPVSGREVIVIEDSVELIDSVENIKNAHESDSRVLEEEKSQSIDENKITKKRNLSCKEDNADDKSSDESKCKKKSKVLFSSVVDSRMEDENNIKKNVDDNVVQVIDDNSVEIVINNEDVKCASPELMPDNIKGALSDKKTFSKTSSSNICKLNHEPKPANDFKSIKAPHAEKVSQVTLKVNKSKRKISGVSKNQKTNTTGSSKRFKRKTVAQKLNFNKTEGMKNNSAVKVLVDEQNLPSSFIKIASVDETEDCKEADNVILVEETDIKEVCAIEKTPSSVSETSDCVEETSQDISTKSDSFVSEKSSNNNSISSSVNLKNKSPKSTTKRHLTPKQLLKKQESEKKHQEREKQKMEKERLKKEKEEKLNQMKEERKRLKIEKEEIKKREKEEKEKKRQMELELKNEEKRAKEEEKKAKEEEKRKREEAKEEEKRKRDEAKEEERRKKEAEKRKEEKAATNFASFFTPKRSDNKSSLSTSTEDVTDSAVVADKFMPFEVKADMRLAAVHRRTLETENKEALDSSLLSQSCDRSDLYIEKLKSKQHLPLRDNRTWPLLDDTDDDVIVIESEIVEDENEGDKEINCEKKRLQRPRAKLLQFHENRRPPYWGTWRKKSSVIGPRKPFAQDNAMFEYDIDSDDEWEEEEPGESLHGSDDEKESEDEYEVDNKVFVPHGYLSDEEGKDEIEDMSPEAQKAKLHFLELEFEAEMKEKTEKLKPRLIGCVWFPNSIEDPKSVGSHIAELLLSRRAVLWDNVTVPIDVEPSNSLSTSPVNTPAKSEQNKVPKSSVFPESAVPSLIKLIHGNRFKHQFLVEEFYNYMSQNSKSISEVPSKKAISNKKREISEWTVYPQEESSNHPMTGRRCWYVSKEVRKEYGMLDKTCSDDDVWMYSLEVPRSSNTLNSPSVVEQTPPVTPITKFTKVLSQEERQKQLAVQSGSSNLSSNEKRKQNPLTPVSSRKSVKKFPSKKVRGNVMDVFIKAKAKKSKNRPLSSEIIDVIELSPEKTDPSKNVDCNEIVVLSPDKSTVDHSKNSKSLDEENNSKKSAVNEKTAITCAKPIKRIKPICLSPMKHKKKV